MPEAAAIPLEVLVVDDQADARRLLERELGDAGLAVRCAADGESAIASIAARRPDAVLLDVKMAGLDGFETCERIRAIDEDLPIVFATGLEDTEHVVRGFEVGATDYVTKPISVPEVVARLLAHTRIARMVRATREAVDATEVAMLAAGRGRLLWTNAAARALLERRLPGIALDDDAPLSAVLSAALEEAARTGVATLSPGGATLRLRTAGEAGAAMRVVVLDEPAPDRAPLDATRSGGRAGAAGAPEARGATALATPAAAVREAADAGWAPPLTGRETEVLLWVARGKTNRDIAEILGMSPRTVNKHLEHVFEKLGVETRTAAAAAARRLRLGD